MIEAHIICRCPFIRIQDLGLSLQKGQEAWVGAEKAKASKDLKIAHESYGVELRYAQRCREKRDLPPDKGQTPIVPKAPKKLFVEPNVPVNVPELIRDSLRERDQNLAEGFFARMEGMLKKEMRDFMSSLPVASQGQPKKMDTPSISPAEREFPMFIPDKLVGDSNTEGIQLQEQDEENSSLDASMKALRAMKRGNKDAKS